MKGKLLATGGVVALAVVVAALVLVPAPVLGLAVSDSATFQAQPAAPPADAVSERGYEQGQSERIVVERDLEAAGQSKTVAVNNELRTYRKTVAVQDREFDGAVLATVSTPNVEIGPRSFNPVADMSHADLLSRFSSELDGSYGDLDDLEKVDEHQVPVLGTPTNVSQFETSVTVEGQDVSVYVYVATVESEGDVVVLVGGHPAPFAQERVHLFELFDAVEHPSN